MQKSYRYVVSDIFCQALITLGFNTVFWTSEMGVCKPNGNSFLCTQHFRKHQGP